MIIHYQDCLVCENAPEHVRCHACGMTGPEIAKARRAEDTRIAMARQKQARKQALSRLVARHQAEFAELLATEYQTII